MDKIFNNWKDYDYSSGQFYLKEENLKGSMYGGTGAIYFIDLNNALLNGKICKQISLNYDWHKKGSDCLLLNFIREKYNNDIKKLFNELLNTAINNHLTIMYQQKGENHKIEVYIRDLKSNRVFSILHLNRIKPLKEIPQKMTLRHAIKAIANNQVKNLECSGVYTDDYAFDNAYNYQKGSLNNIAFVERLIENPRGWHVWENAKGSLSYSINCHSFDNNDFVLAI